MNAFLQAQAALIAAAASTGPDMTEAQKGGGGARTLPDGYAFGQLVEYIEFGNQPQKYDGVAKDPAPVMQLGFALTGTGYANDDGSPYLLRTYTMALSRNEKAKAFLLFKALNWKGDGRTHFAQLLGEKFLVKITQSTPKAPAKPRSIIDLKGFLPPLDPVTKMPYPISDAPDTMYRLFLWDQPTIEGWNSLHIEGEFEAKDGMPARSKNFVQEEILSATDFSGSPLEQLLLSTGTAFTRPAPKPAAVAPAAPPMVPPATPAVPAATPVAPAVAPVAPSVVPTAPAVVPTVTVPAAATVPTPAVANPPFAGGTPVAPAMPAMPSMPAMPAMPA